MSIRHKTILLLCLSLVALLLITTLVARNFFLDNYL